MKYNNTCNRWSTKLGTAFSLPLSGRWKFMLANSNCTNPFSTAHFVGGKAPVPAFYKLFAQFKTPSVDRARSYRFLFPGKSTICNMSKGISKMKLLVWGSALRSRITSAI